MENQKPMHKISPWQLRLFERRALLLLGDFIVGIISLGLALYYWGSSERFMGFGWEFLQTRVPGWFYLLPFLWLICLVELYDIHRAGDWKRTVRGVALAALLGFSVYLLLYFSYVDPPRSALPRRGVASFLILVSLLTLAWRWLYIRVFTAPQFLRRVLIVGGGKTGQILLQIINDLKPMPFYIAGIIDDDPLKRDQQIEGYAVIGTSQEMLDIIVERHVTDLVVAISGEMQGKMFQALLDAQELGVEITQMPLMYEELLGRVPIRLLEADWIIRAFVDQARVSGFYEMSKRLVDLVGGLVGTIIFLLVLPFVSLAILIDDGFPIFYSQVRSGRGGQLYRIIKFRTMRRDAEADGVPKWAKESDERAIRVGVFLRKAHLDELPQFLNVLRGEMSLVGPRSERPELIQLFQKHVPFYRARLLVKPGMTGWAQVNQTYAATIEETIVKLEYDLFYIKHRNLIMDFVIMLRTFSMVFGLRGR